MTEIDFRDSECRWHVGKVVDGVKQPDGLHVVPGAETVRKQLSESLGGLVKGAKGNPTLFKVEREVGGVFVLTSVR